jgi:hypothetical protein
MGVVVGWPTRKPGRPYRWVSDLSSGRPASTCARHKERTDPLGVCAWCLVAWRTDLGAADPLEWKVCTDCGFPIHPAAEGPGVDTCPSCDPAGAAPAPSGNWSGVPLVSLGSPAGTDVAERPVSDLRTPGDAVAGQL